MNNLAESYRLVGRTQEALKLNQQALEIRKRVLGDDHPDTLESMRFRLLILFDLGMTEQLRSLLRVTLPALEKVRGMDHPHTLWVRERFGTELALL
jgi:Tetratricopeptide repeat